MNNYDEGGSRSWVTVEYTMEASNTNEYTRRCLDYAGIDAWRRGAQGE